MHGHAQNCTCEACALSGPEGGCGCASSCCRPSACGVCSLRSATCTAGAPFAAPSKSGGSPACAAGAGGGALLLGCWAQQRASSASSRDARARMSSTIARGLGTWLLRTCSQGYHRRCSMATQAPSGKGSVPKTSQHTQQALGKLSCTPFQVSLQPNNRRSP